MAAAVADEVENPHFRTIKFGFDSLACNDAFARNVDLTVQNVSKMAYLASTYLHDDIYSAIINNRQNVLDRVFPPRAIKPKIDHYFDAVSFFFCMLLLYSDGVIVANCLEIDLVF